MKFSSKFLFELYKNSSQKPDNCHIEVERYRLIRSLFEKTKVNTNSILADIGGGSGLALSHIELSRFKLVILVDLSPQRVKDAKKRIKSSNPNVSFIIGDARHIPLRTGSCDNILCLELIEHIPHYQDVINEIRRLFYERERAYLILSTPNRESKYRQRKKITISNIKGFFRILALILEGKIGIKEFLLIIKNLLKGRHHTHVREFSFNEIVNEFSGLNFKLIKSYGYVPAKRKFAPINNNTDNSIYTSMIFLMERP